MRFARAFGLVTLICIAHVGCASPAGTPDVASEEDDIRARTTTLTFPLIGHEYDRTTRTWTTVELASLNPALEAAGLPAFTKALTFGRADGKEKFEELLARVDAANEALGREIEFLQDWDPSAYVGLCYTGIVTGVRPTIESLRGAAFSEYMGSPGYRYRSTKRFDGYGMAEEEFLDLHRDTNADQVGIWEGFDTSSDAFLMLADGGQQGDGTELFALLVPKCQ